MLWPESINLSLPDGAKARIDAVLRKDQGESRLDMIRSAIDAEIERRDAARAAGKEEDPEI